MAVLEAGRPLSRWRLPGASARVRAAVSRADQAAARAATAGPGRVVRGPRVERGLVRERHRGAVRRPVRPRVPLGASRASWAAARTSGAVRCLRLSDIDFKAASHDGVGRDWPIGYADLEPYYDLVEDYVGVAALPEGLAEFPDGHFLPAMPFTCAEAALRTRAQVEVRPDAHAGTHRQPHAAASRTSALSLLRPVRARLHHALLLQLRVHDDGGCGGDGQVHRRDRRHGLPGDRRSIDAPGARRPLYRSRHSSAPRDFRPRRRPLRADAGVDSRSC